MRPDFAPCDFWFFTNLKLPLKGRRFVNSTVTQYTSSVNGVSLPTDYPHGRVTVHECAVRSPLLGAKLHQGHTTGSRGIQNDWIHPDRSRTHLISVTNYICAILSLNPSLISSGKCCRNFAKLGYFVSFLLSLFSEVKFKHSIC